MKKILITLLLLIGAIVVKAQQKTENDSEYLKDKNKIYTLVQKQPEFEGGKEQLYRFISKTLKYPAEARNNNTQGKVVLMFVVEIDGTLSDVKVLRGIVDGCDEEAVRVMKACPKWIPGKQNGVSVRSIFSIPISFTLDSN